MANRLIGYGRQDYTIRDKMHSLPANPPHYHLNMPTSLDPHAYTSGRWLGRDKVEQEARYIPFDFDALCQKVIGLCHGALSITACDKKEGGFNRIFIFTTDNAKKIVARLPFRFAGPRRLTTNSEVATIKYRKRSSYTPNAQTLTILPMAVQTNTSIPIPRILDWSDDTSNAIGSEYLIMEHAAGVQLHHIWPTMAGDQQIRCIDAIYQKVKEMVEIEFASYGSLYSANIPLESASKQTINEEFCIGPHCGAIYWDCTVGESRFYHKTHPNQGPCKFSQRLYALLDTYHLLTTGLDLASFADGLVDTGLSRVPPVDPLLQSRPHYHGSVETHVSLLRDGRAVIKEMSQDPRIRNAAAATLFHPDLHKRNIFVSEDNPTIITGIIDWQSCSIEPAFWYADEIPDFAHLMPHPSIQDRFEPNSERCAKAFSLCTQFLVPKLYNPMSLDENLFRPFRYCYRTWKDGAVAFRHELIETSRRWKELGFEGACPYPMPTAKELAAHKKQYKLFETAQNLRSDLSNLLNTASDGWVPPEEWETTELAHKEMFDGMLHAVLTNEDPDDDEPIRNEQDLKMIWPFDI